MGRIAGPAATRSADGVPIESMIGDMTHDSKEGTVKSNRGREWWCERDIVSHYEMERKRSNDKANLFNYAREEVKERMLETPPPLEKRVPKPAAKRKWEEKD
jgi:hypothetical protein